MHTDNGFLKNLSDGKIPSGRKYDIKEVQAWAEVLTATSSDLAVQKLTELEKPPNFIVLLLLRRRHFSRSGFSKLLSYISNALYLEDRKPYKTFKSHGRPGSSLRTATISHKMLLCLRLIDHARLVSASSLEEIARIFLETVGRAPNLSSTMDGALVSRRRAYYLSRCFNAMLGLLSQPAVLNPTYSATVQEKAQFIVLRNMLSRSIPCYLSREGYRALIRVQLMKKKTPKEQDWAYLKRVSWPPWKEDKTGMDADKGPSYGASRAHQIIVWMQEAGYDLGDWEKAAKILSGWDTDGSPTIQTRSPILSALTLDHDAERWKWHEKVLVWTSRVMATRTLRESWACFLSYKSSESEYNQRVYSAMFEKLLHSHTKQPDDENGLNMLGDQHSVMPGDGKESFPEPKSPQELLHVTKPVASPSQLLEDMLSEGIRPQGRLLALLIRKLEPASLVSNLLASYGNKYETALKHILYSPESFEPWKIPDYLLAALLKFITRPDLLPEDLRMLGIEGYIEGFERNHPQDIFSVTLLESAIHFLLVRCPKYAPAWACVISAILRAKTLPVILSIDDRLPIALRRYLIAEALVRRIQELRLDTDPDLFTAMCHALQKAADPESKAMDSKDSDLRVHIASCLNDGRLYIRQQFQALTGNSFRPTDAPLATPNYQLLLIPSPYLLHNYARTLGVLRDYEGLYSLASFLVQHKDELEMGFKEAVGGAARMRRVLVCLRACYESEQSDQIVDAIGSPDEIFPLMREQVELLSEWGGWPTEEEVCQYKEIGMKYHLEPE